MPSPAISTPAAPAMFSENIADHVGSKVALSFSGISLLGRFFGELRKMPHGYEIHSDDTRSFFVIEDHSHEVKLLKTTSDVPVFSIVEKSRS